MIEAIESLRVTGWIAPDGNLISRTAASKNRESFTTLTDLMDDRPETLELYIPALQAAREAHTFLLAGLGLGCLMKGILTFNPDAEIEVIEHDVAVIQAVGPYFALYPNVKIHMGDVLDPQWSQDRYWDYAYIDCWQPFSKHQAEYDQAAKLYAERCHWFGVYQGEF